MTKLVFRERQKWFSPDDPRRHAAQSRAGSVIGSPSRTAGSPSGVVGPLNDRPAGKTKKRRNLGSKENKKRGKRSTKRKRARRLPSQSSSSSASSGLPSSESEADSTDSTGKWDLLNDVWPVETGPSKLQVKEYVEKLSWETLNALQD